MYLSLSLSLSKTDFGLLSSPDLYFFFSFSLLKSSHFSYTERERESVGILKMVKRGIIIAVLLMVGLAFGETSPDYSPAPSPDLGADAEDSPLVHAPTPETASPPSPVSPSPAESPIEHSSPPEPESEHSPSPAPANSPSSSPPMPKDSSYPPPPSPSPSPSPAPEPSEDSDVNHSDIKATDGDKSSSGGGMSGGKKAGIVVGVFAAACVVGVAGVVYKKRQENIRRSRYGYAARELL